MVVSFALAIALLNIFIRLFFELGLAERAAQVIHFILILDLHISFVWIDFFTANWIAKHNSPPVVRLIDIGFIIFKCVIEFDSFTHGDI